MSKVLEFLEIAGIEFNQQSVNLYRKLLVKEIGKFWEAWEARDRWQMMNAICDISFIYDSLYYMDWHINGHQNYHDTLNTIMGLSKVAEFTSEQVMECYEIVCHSNLSKFDNDLDEAVSTDLKYTKLNFDTHHLLLVGSGKYATFSSLDQFGNDGKLYPKGEFLKSLVNYIEPDFGDVIWN